MADSSQPDTAQKAGESGMSQPVREHSMEAVSVTDFSQGSADMSSLLKKINYDPYNEDETELRFLHSKPTCFIVIGKPGSGKTTLAKRLAQEWHCELIHPTELLQQNIDMQTEFGLKCTEILLKGEAVSEEMVINMIERKINSPEVAHHGYVLDDFPTLSEENLTVKDQLELIRNWKLKPDFIVNLKIPDKDLERRRIGQKVDPVTGDIYTEDVYNPEKPVKDLDKDGEEEGEEEEEEAEEEEAPNEDEDMIPELPSEVLERIIVRPEDLPDQVEKNIRKYKVNILRILEEYMADHDQQYLVEMDANQTAPTLFKQLMQRLNCFVLRPAAVPSRIHDPEEEEIPEEIETEELMRMLAPKQMVAPRFRWRRSKFLRNCPVALQEGNIMPGKPDLAVSFLDKMYCLSSPEAMEKFLKNPRPYMLPPQPRPPCKISVLGAPFSGKTTFCHLLAQKYGAKVLDMNQLIEPRLEVERKKTLENTRKDATEAAINQVKAKIKEQLEAEQVAREAAEVAAREKAEREAEEREAAKEDEEGEDDEEKEGEETEKDPETTADDGKDGKGSEPKQDGEDAAKNDTEVEKETGVTGTDTVSAGEDVTADDKSITSAQGQDSTASAEQSAVKDQAIVVPEVDGTHPEVLALVEQSVKDAEKAVINLTPEIYLEILEEAIRDAEKQMREAKPDGPLHGGWILDNFPNTRDQWNLCIEKNFIPDDVIVLKDSGDQSKFLMKRWYHSNKQDIDQKIRLRQEEEERRRRQLEEDNRKRAEEEKKRAEEEAKRRAEEERLRKEAEAAEGGGEGGEEEEGETKEETEGEDHKDEEGEEEEEKDEAGEDDAEDGQKQDDDDSDQKTVATSEQGESTDENRVEFKEDIEEKIPEGPEMDEYKDKRKDFDKEFNNILGTISGGSNIDVIQLDVETGAVENLLDEAVTSIERQYKYQGWEYAGIDVDEEEEDLEADAAAGAEEEEEAEAEGEEEDPNRNKKKPLGDTNHYCPVALKETNILFPGNPETAARYREKVYYFSTSEAREKFLASPEEFLPKDAPPNAPPVRLLLLGPRGSGKTVHGRQMAKKLGLFHISFKDRLQELIMHKTKKRIGPEYEEENEEEPPEEEDEDEAAITDPEGKPVEEKTADVSKTSNLTSDSKVSQDEEEIEYSEEEEAIKNNLETEEALSNEVLDNILPQWWHKEPFKSTGFILEGFPRTPEEARYLSEAGLFPDSAVILAVEDTDVIARLLPPKLDKWKVKRDKRMERKRKKKEKEQKKREAAIQKRREELQKEVDERKKERAAQKAAEKAENEEEEEAEEEEEEEEEEEDDIDAQLAEEFGEEEEEEDEEEELEEDATDRMRNEINDIFDNDTNKLAAVTDTFDELLIQKIDVDSTRKPHIVRYVLNKKLKPVVDARQSIFERVYPVNEKLARKMLLMGYKQPSRFGRWCPVKVKEGDCIQTMSGPGYTTFPCVYRSHVYFLSSVQAREEFVNDPVKFTSQPTPKPVVPIKIAVIGPPKSGKTTLANRFAEEYGLLRLSIGEAMRMVMTSQPKSFLTKEMQRHLVKGLTVPDELAVQALEMCLLDMRSQTRGYVLDGFPLTKKQVELMTERCLIPVRVIELDVKNKEIMMRGTKDRIAASRTQPVHDSPKILAMKLSAYSKNIDEVRDWYKKEHLNYKLVDGERSKWWVWNTTLDLARESVRQIQTYLQRISDGKAASISDMCITPSEFLQRMGDYDQYCPVSLALRGELVDCSTNITLDCAAEFRGHYYKCGGKKELDQFLKEPEKYVPPLAPRKLPDPSRLPKRRKPEDVKATTVIELNGYCPVTYLDGKCRYEAITPGQSAFVVEYTGRFWYCENEDKLLKFMKLPEQYAELKLPHKLPPPKESLPVTSLPMLGYMEQSVSTALIKALTMAGNVKPKYPFLSASRSALFYIAYHLKAFNPRSSEYVRKKYKKKLERFQETCDLIKYLGNTMTVRYKEPTERPTDFDYKLQTFFALRGIEPTPTWIS